MRRPGGSRAARLARAFSRQETLVQAIVAAVVRALAQTIVRA